MTGHFFWSPCVVVLQFLGALRVSLNYVSWQCMLFDFFFNIQSQIGLVWFYIESQIVWERANSFFFCARELQNLVKGHTLGMKVETIWYNMYAGNRWENWQKWNRKWFVQSRVLVLQKGRRWNKKSNETLIKQIRWKAITSKEKL